MAIWPEPRHGSFLRNASNRALCDQLEQQLSQVEQSSRGLLEAVLRGVLQEVLAESQLVLEAQALVVASPAGS